MIRSISIGFAASLVFLAGCRSPYVDAAVRNDSERAITLVELDYPSASFGWQTLPGKSERHYRFKVLGSGVTKLSFVDGSGTEHHAAGPPLHEGESGTLHVTVSGDQVSWRPDLKER